jgi:hypothetical protein
VTKRPSVRGRRPAALHRIEAKLRDKNSGLCADVVRSLGDFTVALLTISGNPETPALAGTGTLLTSQGAHYVLTAEHVWSQHLQHGDEVGLTLKPDVRHRFGIPRRAVEVRALPRGKRKEWGPDLALLRVPPALVGSIKNHKVFLNVDRPPTKIGVKGLAVHVLMGTPYVFGTFSSSTANLEITGLFLDKPKEYEKYDSTT